MLTSSAARRSIAKLGINGIGIKWPNDIVVDKRKLAGILIHARHGEANWVTIGLGVNLESSPDVGPHVTTRPISVAELIETVPYEECCAVIVTEFVVSLTQSLSAPHDALDAWRRHLVHQAGDQLVVRLATGVVETGTFEGLTHEGHLILRQNGDEKIISGGDVIETS
jgi:BirA family biotin operon repressor/biotin-[acetyl-CoA-carboxylase] ligase